MPARFEVSTEHPHVALVTLDRPESANALDLETLRDLAQYWERINEDESIRVAVLTGAGDRNFCAGMDMKRTIPAAQRLAAGERVTDEEFRAWLDRWMDDLYLPQPVTPDPVILEPPANGAKKGAPVKKGEDF